MLQIIAGMSMLSGLSLLIIFVLALVAMQLFGGTMEHTISNNAATSMSLGLQC